MKKQEAQSQFYLEMMETIKQFERENAFWNRLESMGFKCSRMSILDSSSIKHKTLPISFSFMMDKKDMTISWTSYGLGGYLTHPEKGKPIITCENYIKFVAYHVRKLCNEALAMLD